MKEIKIPKRRRIIESGVKGRRNQMGIYFQRTLCTNMNLLKVYIITIILIIILLCITL